jgi:DNA-binding GntR family transcriptional regulator
MQSYGLARSTHVCNVYSMLHAATFNRRNISDDLANAIRQMVVDGAIEPGSRINEVHLSRELGVSRTPLREAIAGLVREGTLMSVPRIGTFAKPLTIEDFEQVYSIRTLLDPEALRLAGIPSKPHIDRLDRLNKRLAAAHTAEDVIALDDEWHLLLIEKCSNDILLDLIRDFMRRTRRYELALMREQENVWAATDQHQAIIAALRDGDLGRAVDGLRLNMRSGFQPIFQWLKTREGQVS